MNKLKDIYTKFEKIVSGVKFAVIIILLFAVTLTYGTFMESYHGTDYANRLVYKSWWFILLEICMFLSIFMATVVRLPPKKRLYGFYTIHAGLIILFIGSFFTYINGVDGSLQLLPNTPSRTIFINEDLLRINFPKKSYKLALPYTHKSIRINSSIDDLEIVEFLPFAEESIEWKSLKGHNSDQHSSQYLLFNQNFSQDFLLSLSPKSEFKSMETMGLLNVHYMPSLLKECFIKDSKSGFVIWNLLTGRCFTPEEKNYPVDKTEKNTRFVLVPFEGGYLKFFPDFSPVAVNNDLTKNPNTPFRVLSKHIFQEKPNLFLFGEDISFYQKRKKKWVSKNVKDQIAKLPWMGFSLRLLRHEKDLIPTKVPKAVTPIQDNGQVVKGNIKAVKVRFHKKEYWVRNDAPLQLTTTDGKESLKIQIGLKERKLPYQITLERFKMNTNPGTKDPASYESFVQLLDGRNPNGISKHHVFMNNPLKYDDFTFYQSSYFPVSKDQYASVFSVNYDPGRFFKYLGSLLIVLGSIWHYIINRKKRKVTP